MICKCYQWKPGCKIFLWQIRVLGGSPLPGYVDILVSLLPLVICERNTIFKIITSDSIYDNRKNSEVIF